MDGIKSFVVKANYVITPITKGVYDTPINAYGVYKRRLSILSLLQAGIKIYNVSNLSSAVHVIDFATANAKDSFVWKLSVCS